MKMTEQITKTFSGNELLILKILSDQDELTTSEIAEKLYKKKAPVHARAVVSDAVRRIIKKTQHNKQLGFKLVYRGDLGRNGKTVKLQTQPI